MCFKSTALSAAFERGVYRCPCCDVQLVWKSNCERIQSNLATVDHIVPKSKGGANVPGNMYVMCRKCNERRGNSCFVNFITAAGVSKSEAELIYRQAHIESVKSWLLNLINQSNNKTVCKKFKNSIKGVVRNYSGYFQDYLPEFNLLPTELCK